MNNTKYYDKQIYEIEQVIKTQLLILAIFIISFTIGFFAGNKQINYKEEQIQKTQIQKNNLKK